MFHQVRRLKSAVERSKERQGTELRLISDFEGLRGLVRDRDGHV